MAVFAVEIDQVDENEAAVGGLAERAKREVDVGGVVAALDLAAGEAMGEDVADLADRRDLAPRLDRALQQIVGQRRNREILAVGGAGEIGGGRGRRTAGR